MPRVLAILPATTRGTAADGATFNRIAHATTESVGWAEARPGPGCERDNS